VGNSWRLLTVSKQLQLLRFGDDLDKRSGLTSLPKGVKKSIA
jgi:hypothetical protein